MPDSDEIEDNFNQMKRLPLSPNLSLLRRLFSCFLVGFFICSPALHVFQLLFAHYLHGTVSSLNTSSVMVNIDRIFRFLDLIIVNILSPQMLECYLKQAIMFSKMLFMITFPCHSTLYFKTSAGDGALLNGPRMN